MQVTKKQHYVMQNYLKRWIGKRDRQKDGIWVKDTGNNSIFFITNLNSIAQERYFYELHLDDDTFGLLRYQFERFPECKKGLCFLSLLVKINSYKEGKLLGHDELHKINKNILENEYSKLENRLAPILQSIDDDLFSYLKKLINIEEDLRDLVYLFVFQVFRTKKMRGILASKMSNIFVDNDDGSKKLTEEQKENYFKASMYLYSMKSAEDLCNSDFSIEFLINTNNTLFITSDAPAVITRSSNDLSSTDMSELEGFIPLTPNILMIVRGARPLNKNFTMKFIDQIEVLKFNKLMINSQCSQIYSKKNIKK